MKKNKLFLFLIPIMQYGTVFADDVNNKISDFGKTISFYTNIFIAFSLATSILVLIIHFVRLAIVAHNPKLKKEVLGNIITTCIVTAITGTIWGIAILVLRTFL